MAYKMKGFSGFKSSPAKAATDPTKGMNAEQKAIWEKNRKDYQDSSQATEDKLNANLKKMSGEKSDLEKELEKRKNKKSPAKLFGMGKSARQKRARKYELEDRETARLAHENASLTGHTGEGNR